MSTKAKEAKDAQEIKVMGVDVSGASRRAWLASLGVVAMAQDEMVRMANRMVERGTLTEREGRKMLDEAMAWPQKSLKIATKELDRQTDALLDWLGVPTMSDIQRMDLPTRGDIDALSEKVAALSRKVEQLRKIEEDQIERIEAVRKAEEKQTRKIEEVRKAEQAQAEAAQPEPRKAEPAKSSKSEPAKT